MQTSDELLRRQQYLMERIYTNPGELSADKYLELNRELYRTEQEIVNRGITSKKVIRKMNHHAICMRVT